MAQTSVVINVAVAGDHFDIRREITGVPAGQSLTKAWFTAKLAATDLDGAAIVSKIITTTPDTPGHITDDGALDTIGEVVFLLTPTDTLAIYNNGPLVFDVQVMTNLNKIYTAMTLCTISMIQQVTLATS